MFNYFQVDLGSNFGTMDKHQKRSRVKATLSKDQWKRIDDAVNAIGKTNLQSHITSKLHDIDILCHGIEVIEQCEGCKEERFFWLTPSASEILSRISKKTGIRDASTIVAKFIIAPLLLKD